MNKKLIYIPSFGTGAIAANIKKNAFLGDIPARFYGSDMPEEFKYPYFLISAGHAYKDMKAKEKFGFEDDTVVFGDSGGFQILTGVLKYETKEQQKNLREKIFTWLDSTSTVAMNLDIPPRKGKTGNLLECLDLSIENFKYFEKHQSGKTQFLNVLQGGSISGFNTWYKKVKDFQFAGWSVGGGSGGGIITILAGLATLCKYKEHLKDSNEWLHYLGVTDIMSLMVLTQIQKSLNDVESKMQVTVDSSTPSMQSVFGTMYVGHCLKRCNYDTVHVEKLVESYKEYDDYPMPVCTPYDNWLNKFITLGKMSEFTQVNYIGFVQHNMYGMLSAIDEMTYYISGHPYLLQSRIKPDMFRLLNAIDEIIKSSTPVKTFHQHKAMIEKVQRNNVQKSTIQKLSKSKFFKQ